MVELEIDGRKVEIQEGSMVMHAADQLGVYIPHFCYHKKLSIAANCRMCLVDVEKAPKPLPACATPVSNGMKVFTRSDKALKAQQGVMEFLLINHPLDCPICDQGGECQLQDLAVGYGRSASRYTEEKRVVFHKNLGPLVAAEEMARCIQCTRCIRFGQEIGGVMELGMGGRGEHSEILSFVGRSVDSELSGNMIDICPVGALTSKPFRYSARTWELSRRRSIAPHDSLGSNLIVQIKGDRVMRVVPYEEESLNECWLSDRDRFSYEGLNSDERLLKPMLKQDGQWHEVDWQTALQYAGHALADVKRKDGASAIGALASPNATVEELFLLARLMRGLGSENIDTRLRQSDFSGDGPFDQAPWLGMPVAQVNDRDGFLLIGSFLRKDQPLLAARVRQAVKGGARVSVLHAVDDDLLMPLAAKAVVAPDRWVSMLSAVLVAVSRERGLPVPAGFETIEPDESAVQLARSVLGERGAVLLGNAAQQHADYARIAWLAQAIASAAGASFGHLVDAANAVGAHIVGARPGVGGLNAREMVEQPRKAYLLLNIEPTLDHAFPALADAAMAQAGTVIALSSYRSAELLERADCLLPVAPFTETSGTFVNCEGRAQSFNGVVRPAGNARPAWKVLRVLGNLLEIDGFDFDSSEAVRGEALAAEIASRLEAAGHPAGAWASMPAPASGTESAGGSTMQRIADVPIYATDALVRRASSLQETRDAATPTARVNSAGLLRLGIAAGDRAKLSQDGHEIVVTVALDDRVADDTIRLAAASPVTAGLPGSTGRLRVEKV